MSSLEIQKPTGMVSSWGQMFRYPHQVYTPRHISDLEPLIYKKEEGSFLAYGLGRSYGDSCLNQGHSLVKTNMLDHIISFDRGTGILRCEAGISLAQILSVIIPAGFFLPVTPGTKYVTLGGAIANDVHGKNHHQNGTFAGHVRCLELIRSDGKYLCSSESNPDLFYATLGGLGLTGVISWAEIQLIPASHLIDAEEISFHGVEEFLELCADSDKKFQYTVAWIDCMGMGPKFARGVFFRGNHAKISQPPTEFHSGQKLSIPLPLPDFVLSKYSVAAFNEVYFHSHSRRKQYKTSFDSFFYPLDSVGYWNRLYGKRGFFQYQFVLPKEKIVQIKQIMELIAQSKQASFLAVLKEFGEIKSKGLLSFPRPGITLALDFPYNGQKSLNLIKSLTEIVNAHGGRLYPAKDSFMTHSDFSLYYKNEIDTFREFVDPIFSSNFWRRASCES